jgi:dihydroorotase
MRNFDLVIANGKVVFKDKVITTNIGVINQVITEIFEDQSIEYKSKCTIDATNKYVLPGLIDSHVHFRTPGLTHKETWMTGSKAAVAGGITTVLDMPNTNPYLSSVSLIDEKKKLIDGNSYVDYGFHFGVEPKKIEQLESLEPDMIASIKVFLTGHHTAKNVITNLIELDNIFRIAAKKNIMLTLHAEDEEILNLLKKFKTTPKNLIEYEEYLPRTASIIAIGKILVLIKKYGTKVHVLHVSSKEEVELISAAAKSGYPISFETTPHQLWFDAETNVNLGSRIKLSPAIRLEKDKIALWESLINGNMISVGSDHAPHTNEEKEMAFFDAPPGLPGVQEMVSVLTTGLLQHKLNLTHDEVMSHIVSVLSYGPAHLFGISHQKGNIKVGLDADFVILDIDNEWEVKNKDVFYLCKWSAYEKEKLKAKPLITIRRGEVVYNNGIFGSKSGKPIKFTSNW